MYVHDCQRGRHACKCRHKVSQIVVGAWAIIFIIGHNEFSTGILNPPERERDERPWKRSNKQRHQQQQVLLSTTRTTITTGAAVATMTVLATNSTRSIVLY
jgi:hypothetical protein